MRAVIYARYSSERQRAESIADQVRVCSEYAEREALDVVAVYADEARSGTSDDRADFQRMIGDSASGDWERVIVYKLDRFARDRYASAIYRKRLRDNGVSVLSATEGIPDTPEGIILESVIEGYNAYYSRQLGQNVKRGMEGNARRCLVNGVKMYGYETAPDGTYQIKEPEASHIREAFRLRADGYRIGSIAQELYPRMGKTYKQAYSTIRDAFSNCKYMGDYKWGDVYIPGGMPAIVSASEWEAVQRMRGHVRMKSKRAYYPLAGRIVGSDGRRFHGESANSRGRKYYYYSDGRFRISRDKLDAIVSSAIQDCLKDEKLLDRLAKGTASAAQRFDRPGRKASEVEREIANMTDLIAKIGADEASLEKLSALRRELDEIQMAEAKQKMADALTADHIRDWIVHFAATGSEAALDAFVDSVTIDHDGRDISCITIQFNWHKTSEPDALDQFALESFGTPYPKNSNIIIYPWGFTISIRAA